MKAMRLSDSAEPPVLVEENIPRPQPGRGELLIQIYAAGVTSKELLWYPTTHSKNGERRSRAIPSHEFSGVVAAVGGGVVGFEVGQEVYGMNDWFAEGALAEYCITEPASVARKPANLSHVQAASVPIGALTAWQGLIDRAKLQAGERVLVHGGAGAVGIFAIQLARFHGAHVTATASARNHAFVAELGAEQVIDYQAVPFEKKAQGMDVVFDTVGGDTLERSWEVLKTDGRLVTIAAESEATPDERAKQAFFIVEPSHEQLTRIGELLTAGQLHTFVDAAVPLAQAGAAYTGAVKERRGRGKLVVTVAP
ncbi:MAG TPA: NADP-dependent oxidoreductase [Candidatus Binatia bacterium]|jgi:NADPH:quinone reductase-like Zn-dependent oxidoreductase|nr:NADP-dependent oxidoreductase [Candidatus Binatia bacterium]